MGGLTAAELAQAAGRLAWSAMVRLPAKTVVLQCHCWGGWSLVALIDLPAVIRKILAHLGLTTEMLVRPKDPVWRVLGLRQLPPERAVVGRAVCGGMGGAIGGPEGLLHGGALGGLGS
jgi:hypothetical protein